MPTLSQHSPSVQARWRMLIRADVSWESLAVRHVDALGTANGDAEATAGERASRQSGKCKKVSVTDPDASCQ